MYDCISIGDIKLDTFVVIHEASLQCHLKLPECYLCIEYGKKIPVQAIDSQVAGSAINVAIGLARLKHDTAVVSVMGKDGTRRMALERMKEEDVDARYVMTDPKRGSSFSVVLNFKGEKTILAAHEPYNYRLPKLASAKWLYVCELGSGYRTLYQKITNSVKIDGVHLAVNPGAVQIEEGRPELYRLLATSSLIFLNVGEARALTKLKGSAKIAQILAAAWRLNRKQAVVTDGRNGAYSFDGEEMLYLPIFPGKRVESTGAGDSFATGVLGAILHKLPLREALRWGAVNSASVVGQVGPQAGLLSEREIKARLDARPSFKSNLL